MRKSFIRRSNGIAYIFIPPDVDRDQFVADCMNRGTVSICIEKSEVIHNVLISKNALQDVEFPESTSELGSMVSFVTISEYSMPVILGVYNKIDETFGFLEHEFQLSKDFGGNSVNISGNGETGDLSIGIDANTGGSINITAVGNSDAKVKIKCSGNVEIESENEIKHTSESDHFIDAKSLQAKVDELRLNEGNVGLVTEGVLDVVSGFIDLYISHTHPTAVGPSSPPTNAPQATNLKANLEGNATSRIKVDK